MSNSDYAKREKLTPYADSYYSIVTKYLDGQPVDIYLTFDDEGICWICNWSNCGRDGCRGHTKEQAHQRYGDDLSRFNRP